MGENRRSSRTAASAADGDVLSAVGDLALTALETAFGAHVFVDAPH
jgi:hypothetical protein